ncbi:hypothetical protein AVEN_182931-1 [Araneus ventricosus]|uniref:Uncharacterized protein n=1 Tax=Araneus ventricosus TaxID=182803 RepID=A0A4Y2PC88_ARAVE|nr:hypothetical protein AVEN_182931-1 [Araneus ventricosus]
MCSLNYRSRNDVLNETPSKIECDTAKLILLFKDAVLSYYCKTCCEETVINEAATKRCMPPFMPISSICASMDHLHPYIPYIGNVFYSLLYHD